MELSSCLMSSKHSFFALLFLAAMLFLHGCGGNTTTTTTKAPPTTTPAPTPPPSTPAPTPVPTPKGWKLLGEGCCHNAASVAKGDKIHDGPPKKGMDCFSLCLQNSTGCGFVSVFPNNSWCTVLMKTANCSSLDAKDVVCANNETGAGVETYNYTNSTNGTTVFAPAIV